MTPRTSGARVHPLSGGRRTVLASVFVAGAGTALAAAGCARLARTAAPAGATRVSGKVATIELEKGGTITIQLFPDVAPRTVQNFEQKANAGFYNGLTFHRVEDWVVQGGDPTGTGAGGSLTLPTELSDRPFVAGAVGVPRIASEVRVGNDAQFFICLKPAEHLNRQYTNFGQVVEGLAVAQSIARGDRIRRISVSG